MPVPPFSFHNIFQKNQRRIGADAVRGLRFPPLFSLIVFLKNLNSAPSLFWSTLVFIFLQFRAFISPSSSVNFALVYLNLYIFGSDSFWAMAAPPARARADYDYLIKLLLIGDSGMNLFSSPYYFVYLKLECDFVAFFCSIMIAF